MYRGWKYANMEYRWYTKTDVGGLYTCILHLNVQPVHTRKRAILIGTRPVPDLASASTQRSVSGELLCMVSELHLSFIWASSELVTMVNMDCISCGCSIGLNKAKSKMGMYLSCVYWYKIVLPGYIKMTVYYIILNDLWMLNDFIDVTMDESLNDVQMLYCMMQILCF